MPLDPQILQRLRNNDPSLTQLNLAYNKIGEAGAKHLSDALKVNQSLRELQLYNNKIGDAGAKDLSDALKVNQSLTKLRLTSNEIGHVGASYLSDALKVNPSLTQLALAYNKIGDVGASYLSDTLKVNRSLRELNLGSNQIGDAGAKALSDALKVNPSLTELNLGSNQIGEAGAKHLSHALKVNPSLMELDLHDNQIGDAGAKDLSDALKVNPSLMGLYLYNNQIGVVGAKHFSDALKVNPSLTELDLDDNQIGDAGANDIQVVERYLTRNQQVAKQKNAQRYFQQAKQLAAEQRYSDALPLLQQAAKLQPNDEAIQQALKEANQMYAKKEVEKKLTIDQPSPIQLPASTPNFASSPAVHPGPIVIQPRGFPALKGKETTQPLGQINLSFSIPYAALGFSEKLGQGGFGIVFKGTWQHSEVAIKQLHMDKSSTDTLEEFQRETQVMVQLNHPHVIRLYGVCIDQSPYCLVMEYMPKGSLYDVLRNTLPLTQALQEQIAIDIACGLAYLHDKDILHRDLKSLNVLLDDRLHAKLADFGLAKVKLEASTTSSHRAVGTTRWMAPEIMEEQPYARSADMYSYGVVLWELAARKIPFEGKPDLAVMRQVTQGKRETIDAIPANCPSKLSRLIRHCWIMEPAKRPSAEEAITQLRTVSSPGAADSYLDNFDSDRQASSSHSGSAPAAHQR
jgi:Ran GTPase-activating protein (RanGAP) involved in mRNA processing and transport/predicted Ser/Thr protein kinase